MVKGATPNKTGAYSTGFVKEPHLLAAYREAALFSLAIL